MEFVKEVQVTLYDVFGYLVPGTVVVSAAALLFCVFYLPPAPTAYTAPDLLAWVIGIVVAYFAGHMAQALGNLTERWFKSIEAIVLQGEGPYGLDDEIIKACRAKLTDRLRLDASKLKPRGFYRQCDDAVIRSGKIGERDVYVYREGFYRGSAIAFLLLAASSLLLIGRLYVSLFLSVSPNVWAAWHLALWIVWPVAVSAAAVVLCVARAKRWSWWVAAILLIVCAGALLLLVPRQFFGQHAIDVDGWERYREVIWFVLGVSLCCSYLSFRRYRRFGMYRVTQAIQGFLSLRDDKKDEKNGERGVVAEPAG